ncbi:CHASE3 domain-containing protein, partial [Noviherbaspirillum denitrificans]|uniref:CHASE3 domain-containing protein n=1 Tax=Noviherbaspirillum denitrificans TaxID=1968433 RepID=UPI0019811692
MTAAQAAMRIEGKIKALIAVAVLVMLATAIVPFMTAEKAAQLQEALLDSEARIQVISEALSLMKDAETGQRGFIITGQESFLEPYHKALAHLESQETVRRASLAGRTPAEIDRFE